MRRDPVLVRADRLRAIMAMPEYHVTIGAWIDEAGREVLHSLTSAKEVHEIHRAQGAYSAIENLKAQFAKVFASEQVILEKQHKRTQNALKE
jgi:hypothetical protein